MKNPSMEIIDPPASPTGCLSHLPLEIHLLIFEKLDYVEFSRFSVVCKAWRSIASAARKIPSFRLQQLQVLIHGVSPARKLPRLSHQINNLYKLELLGIHDSCCICGSSQGWLLLTQSPTNFLLNPITRQRISLPENPTSIENCLEMGVILPPCDGGMEVVAFFRYESFYHWRSQDQHWTKIVGQPRLSFMSDMIYHKGNIYATLHYIVDGFFIIGICSDRPYYWLRSPGSHDINPRIMHLVECDGDLLMVVSSYRHSKRYTTTKVTVFKYINTVERSWEKVESIGEKYALFVRTGNSIAIDVSTNTSFRANCVYFLEGQRIRCFEYLGKNEFNGVFMPYTWYVNDRIRSDATLPTWFMPNLK